MYIGIRVYVPPRRTRFAMFTRRDFLRHKSLSRLAKNKMKIIAAFNDMQRSTID